MDDFDLFWKHYPKKVGKAKAIVVWDRKYIKGEIPEIGNLLAKITEQVEYKDRCKQNNLFCPAWPDPERYIKYERWEDEVNHEANVGAVKESPGERAARIRFEAEVATGRGYSAEKCERSIIQIDGDVLGQND